MYCIAGIGWENDQGSPGFPRNIIIDQEMLTPFLERHFTYLNHICEWLELPIEEVKRISLAIGSRGSGYPDDSSSRETGT